jgi:hypothetical protein
MAFGLTSKRSPRASTLWILWLRYASLTSLWHEDAGGEVVSNPLGHFLNTQLLPGDTLQEIFRGMVEHVLELVHHGEVLSERILRGINRQDP